MSLLLGDFGEEKRNITKTDQVDTVTQYADQINKPEQADDSA